MKIDVFVAPPAPRGQGHGAARQSANRFTYTGDQFIFSEPAQKSAGARETAPPASGFWGWLSHLFD